jgi:hypothetical protein
MGSEAKAALLFAFSSTPVIPAGPPPGTDVFPNVTVTYTGNSGSSDADGTGTDIKVSFITLTTPTATGFISSPFEFEIEITDLTTLAVETFTVAGVMSGTVTPDSSSLSFVFTSVPQTKTFSGRGGTVTYTVGPKFLDVPTVELGGLTQPGSLTAHVEGEITVIPEPGTVVLGLLGVPFGLVALRRRARRALA